MDIGIGEIVTIAIAMVGVIISVNFVLARYQDRLRRAELKRIEDHLKQVEDQVYNHLPTDIKDLRGDMKDMRNELKGDIKEIGAKLDQLMEAMINVS